MNVLYKSLRGPYGLIGAPGVDKVLGKDFGRFTSDPMNLFPKRPVVNEYVSASGNPGSRKSAGYSAGLMGLSRLTG